MNKAAKESASTATDSTEPASAELMYVKCSVCGKWMDVKPGHMNGISHSFCPECYAAEMSKLSPPKPDSEKS